MSLTSIYRFQIEYEPLNLNRLQYLIDGGRIDASQPITMHTLHKAGAVGKIKHGVKLLADVSVLKCRSFISILACVLIP